MLPHFLIIGAPKSATTFLQSVLSLHPEIFIPKHEVPFFEDPDFGDGDLEPLKILYQGAPTDARLGLKRPNYLGKPECPERIARHIPAAKLIAVLRNPVSRSVSAYFQQMRNGFIPCVELNKGMLNLINGKYRDKYPRSKEILEFGLYAEQLRRYFEYFPRENFYIISQERLLNNKEKNIEDVCNFLGVDSNKLRKTYENKVNEGVYSLPRIRLHQIVHSLRNVVSPDGMRSHPRRGSLARTKKSIGYAILVFDKMFARLISNKQPSLNAEMRTRIQEFYKDDLTDLELLLGADFSNWNR